MKPHPFTSRLARFKNNVSVSPSPFHPLASIISSARCEITSTTTTRPIGLHLSSQGTCLVLHGVGGWKNRCPYLQYVFPTTPTDIFPSHPEQNMKLGFADIAYWTATDEDRYLIFAADNRRIKSFAWASPAGTTHTSALPRHTMKSGMYKGPLAVLPGGRLIRAGRGAVAVWNLDGLPTHGEDGEALIWGHLDWEDTGRDDPEEVELSSGSPVDTVIKFEDEGFYPLVWHAHPSQVGSMICAADPKKTRAGGGEGSCSYSTVVVDLEDGGRSVQRYVGHGAELSAGGIATDPAGDPNVFLTACLDGYARLYDVRHPLPVLTMNSGGGKEGCPAAVLLHPDGTPSSFLFRGVDCI
jgi:WD40 repeat protein